MKKKLSDVMLAIFLVLVMLAGYAPPVIAAEPGDEITASYYILKRQYTGLKSVEKSSDQQYYTLIGKGTIIQPEENPVEDLDEVYGSLVQIPDLSGADLADNEEIEWYRIKIYPPNGQLWVFGKIVESSDWEPSDDADADLADEEPDMLTEDPEPDTDADAPDTAAPADEPVSPEPDELLEIQPIEEVPASFYILKRQYTGLKSVEKSSDQNYYTLVGKGKIEKPEDVLIEGADETNSGILEIPDLETAGLLEDNETVEWYRTRLYTPNGQWWIMGKIVEAPEDDRAASPGAIDPIVTEEPDLPIENPVPEKQPETFRDELYLWLTTGDGNVHDISKYSLTFSQVNDIYTDLYKNDARIAYACYYNLVFNNTTENGKVKNFWLVNTDSGFKDRYAKMLEVVDEVTSMADDNMSDVEKALLVHEYIVSRSTYSNNGGFDTSASGLLTLGKGNCMGFTKATYILLAELGIETYSASSSKMSHAWPMMRLDGEWYQSDPTWDNTRSPVKGEVGHLFFLKTDSEFKTASSNQHYGWDENIYSAPPPTATSQKYSNWFVHSVVGQMYYARGAWYYIYNGDIVRSFIDGSKREVLVKKSEMGTLKITGFDNGIINYTANGNAFSLIEDDLPPLAKSPFEESYAWVLISIVIVLIISAAGFVFFKKRQNVAMREEEDESKSVL